MGIDPIRHLGWYNLKGTSVGEVTSGCWWPLTPGNQNCSERFTAWLAIGKAGNLVSANDKQRTSANLYSLDRGCHSHNGKQTPLIAINDFILCDWVHFAPLWHVGNPRLWNCGLATDYSSCDVTTPSSSKCHGLKHQAESGRQFPWEELFKTKHFLNGRDKKKARSTFLTHKPVEAH